MKTAYKKRPSNTTEPKQDKFISKILENLDKVNASDWERYTNLEGSYPCNLFTGKITKDLTL